MSDLRAEVQRLRDGDDACLDTLEAAGLVVSRVHLKLNGDRLTREETVELTDLGRAAVLGDPGWHEATQ